MLIMTNKIMNTVLSLAAVAFVATACQDTDAQIEILETTAPQLVRVTPDNNTPLLFGEKTIQVVFDKNIGFATKNTSLITLNGVPVKKASVVGVDSALTIVADVDFNKQQTLHIPAGLVIGPQKKTYDQDIDVTWSVSDLPSGNTAVAMTQKLGWGWNLGNHFDTSNTQWGYWDGSTPGTALFQALAGAGAKTVRIPVTWTCHMDDNNTIDAAYLREVEVVVDMALAAGLNVIINTHHDLFETDLANAANDPKVAVADSILISSLWTQVATRFASYDENLIFETFNEVHGGDDWGTGSDAQFALLNKWNQYAVDAIRKTGGINTTRWIAVSGYAANIDLTLAHLVLPNDPANRIIVGVHCYDPYNFCLAPESSGANSWGHNADPAHSVAGANEEYIIEQLYKLRTAYIEKGIPCYLGEYGCVVQTTERANAFRRYYLEFFCRAANLAGIPMFVWDNTDKDPVERGNEANIYINHTTGAYEADGADVVPMMIKACTSNDANYWFDTIWDKSPAAE